MQLDIAADYNAGVFLRVAWTVQAKTSINK